MQLSVEVHFRKENNTKFGFILFIFFFFLVHSLQVFSPQLLSCGPQMVSTLKLFESRLYNKLVP